MATIAVMGITGDSDDDMPHGVVALDLQAQRHLTPEVFLRNAVHDRCHRLVLVITKLEIAPATEWNVKGPR